MTGIANGVLNWIRDCFMRTHFSICVCVGGYFGGRWFGVRMVVRRVHACHRGSCHRAVPLKNAQTAVSLKAALYAVFSYACN